MRLARVLCIGLVPVVLAGCLSDGRQARWLNPFPLLGTAPDADTALIQYVIVERPAGTDEINRRAWDRVDEQVLSYETRNVLQEVGLRVGVAGESAPGALRRLIDQPRTSWGHRARSFALDKPAPLAVTEALPRAEFSMPAANGGRVTFARDRVVLGFDVTVRGGSDGRVHVKLVPRARYTDPSQLLPADLQDRGLATDTFPAASFEIALSPSEYLVIGTDDYWNGTFGHAAFVEPTGERKVQRLLVLRAGRTGPGRTTPTFLSGADEEPVSAPPIASQAGALSARP